MDTFFTTTCGVKIVAIAIYFRIAPLMTSQVGVSTWMCDGQIRTVPTATGDGLFWLFGFKIVLSSGLLCSLSSKTAFWIKPSHHKIVDSKIVKQEM